jgi:hypothetical protein
LKLSGDFQTDLPLPDALAACAEAIHDLGWHIGSVEGRRIVSFPAQQGPKIEVLLNESGRGTDIRIVGSDSDAYRLTQDALIAELDKARDAIELFVEEAETSRPTEVRQTVAPAPLPSSPTPPDTSQEKRASWWREHRLGLALGVIAFFAGVALGTSGGSTETTTVRRTATKTTQGPVRTETQVRTQTVTRSAPVPNSSAGSATPSGSSCDPSYAGAGICLDPNSPDYDCEGGGGDGPDYVSGPVVIVGDDHYGLDASDGDGVGCEGGT